MMYFESWKLERTLSSWVTLMDGVALKEPSSEKETNENVIKLILEFLPNKILCILGKFKNAHDLLTRLIKLHDDPSRLEEKLREESIMTEIKGLNSIQKAKL